MTLKSTLIILLSAAVAACGGAGENTDQGSSSTSAGTQEAVPKRVNADDGNIEIVGFGNRR